jgi:hypothetical protein
VGAIHIEFWTPPIELACIALTTAVPPIVTFSARVSHACDTYDFDDSRRSAPVAPFDIRRRGASRICLGLGETRGVQDLLSRLAGDEVDELVRQVRILGLLEHRDRIDVHRA